MAIKLTLSIPQYEDIPQREDWDEEMESEKRHPGRLNWKNGEYVFPFFHEETE